MLPNFQIRVLLTLWSRYLLAFQVWVRNEVGQGGVVSMTACGYNDNYPYGYLGLWSVLLCGILSQHAAPRLGRISELSSHAG